MGGGAVEHETGKIGLQDFRRREGGQRRRPLGAPQTDRDAGAGAAGTARALVCRGTGDPDRLQSRQSCRRLVSRQAGQSAVDDDTNAVDGDRRLGDRRRQHHLAPPGRRGPDRRILRPAFHVAEERDDVGIGGDPAGQTLRRALDLALAGQEGQHAALLAGERATDCLRDRVLDRCFGQAFLVADVDWKAAARTLDHRRIAEQAGDTRAVERGRHDQEPQVRPERALDVEGQREAEVAVQRTLVELVEQYGCDSRQFRIVEDHARQDAFGDDQDPGVSGGAVFHSHRVADGAA